MDDAIGVEQKANTRQRKASASACSRRRLQMSESPMIAKAITDATGKKSRDEPFMGWVMGMKSYYSDKSKERGLILALLHTCDQILSSVLLSGTR